MEDKIKEIINKELNANVKGIKKIDEGYSHENFNVHIDEEPYEVIARISENEQNKYENLSKQKYAMEKMQNNSLPVPKIYAYFSDKENNFGYMLLEKMKGKKLSDIWENLSKEEKMQIMKKIGEILNKIHEIKLKNFGNLMAEGEIDHEPDFQFKKQGDQRFKTSPFLKSNLKTYISEMGKLMATKKPSPKTISKLFEYIMKNVNEMEYLGEPTLIHGDFQTGHIFVEKEEEEWKIKGIIDFEFAESSSPDYDFIKLHREELIQDKELKSALEENYGKINERAILIHRILRDMAFARLVLESGNKELYEKTVKNVERMIDEDNKN